MLNGRHNGKPVDLSRTFRQSGLTSGAKLELVAVSKSPSVVSVALQHPDGTRQTDKVPSNTTLWLLLRKFESDPTKNINVTARGVAQIDDGSSGRMYYEAPVVRVMNREFTELEDLQKTLAQIGVNSGSVLINLRYRKTDMPLEAAMSQIGGYFQEVEGDMANSAQAQNTSTNEPSVTEQIAKTATEVPLPEAPPKLQIQDQRQRENTPPEPVISEPAVASPGGRNVEVFAAPTGTVPAAAQSGFNDKDYEPSIADAKRHQKSLEQRNQNRRLLSDAELAAIEEEKRARKEAVRETTIKIKFPDETAVTFKVTLEDTGASLYSFVRGLIMEKCQPFWLVYRGSKRPNERLQDSERVKLIKDVGFNGPTLVTFHWQEGASEQAKRQPALEEEYRKQAKPVQVPEPPAAPDNASDESGGPFEAPKREKPRDNRTPDEKLKAKFGKFFAKK